jgi:branched-chain amino acid transport system ATP-binding protein
MTCIKLSNVTKQFGGLTAVNDFSAEINENDIVGLIGPNGAGKTTLFNMIACTFPPTSGKIEFYGKDITNTRTSDMASLGLARTFQVTRPFGEMTVLENITVGAFLKTGKKSVALDKAWEVSELLGMSNSVHMAAHNLTTVDRKKLEVARALATEPKVLLLDEVMAGCNPQEKVEISQIIRQIRDSGITVVIIEHDIKTIMGLCDWIFLLHRGEKLVEGTPETVGNDKRAISAYLGEDFANA